jgi:hypothetical protein
MLSLTVAVALLLAFARAVRAQAPGTASRDSAEGDILQDATGTR